MKQSLFWRTKGVDIVYVRIRLDVDLHHGSLLGQSICMRER